MMNRLPEIVPSGPDETLQGYGLRILAFVLVTRCTATLSDHDLELADHMYPIAISGPEVSVVAVDRLSEARHLILAAIRTRKAIEPRAPAMVPGGTAPHKPNEGPMARLVPAPKTNPPANVYAKVDIQF